MIIKIKHNWINISLCAVVLLLFVIGWYDVLTWMHDRYISPDSYYSHGFIIPFISGYLIWMNKEKLKTEKIEMSWFGIILVVFAVFLHITGTILYIFSISGFSILFLVFGVSLFLFGKSISSKILFPLLFLVFMFPLPIAILNTVAFPMKLLAAKTAATIVGFAGIPIFQEGFNITIPVGTLLVGNPCSGLRSLLSFMMLGAIFAYLGQMGTIKKYLLFLFSIPIALLSNIIRVTILILIMHFFGIDAASPESIWHDASGVFVFIIGMLLFYYLGRFFSWKI